MTPVLSARALRIGFKGRSLLTGASFDLMPGEVSALIGLNGSGKSTLLRTIAGLSAPLEGSIEVAGEQLMDLSAGMRAKRVSVVLPGRPRTGMLTARELVALGRHPWSGRRAALQEEDLEVKEAMRRTEAEELSARIFDTLSDGEAQRVLIARALAQATPCMLLDEPTAHLDLVNRVTVMRLLRDIARSQGRAVLVATHDLATAMELCDKLLLVHAGTLWNGTPAEALQSGRLAAVFEREGLRLDSLLGLG